MKLFSNPQSFLRLSFLFMTLLIASCSIDVSDNEKKSDIEKALISGSAKNLSEQDLMSALVLQIEQDGASFNPDMIELLNLNADGSSHSNSLTSISWNPSLYSSLLISESGFNRPILVSNDVSDTDYTIKEKAMAIIGKQSNEDSQARYMVMGSNPFRNAQLDSSYVNEQMQQFLINSMVWLAGRNDFSPATPLNIVMAHLDESYFYPDRSSLRTWLNAKFPQMVSYNEQTACDGSALLSCVNDDTDLIIISQMMNSETDIEQVIESIKNILENGKSVLYVHQADYRTDLARELFPLFNVQYYGINYWRRLQLSNGNPALTFNQPEKQQQAIKQLVNRLKNNDFTVDLSLCDDKSCPGSDYDDEFLTAAKYASDIFEQLDNAYIRIFDRPDYHYQKLLILLADKIRETVYFPMDKSSTPRLDFLRSLFADHVNYISRDINPVQPDMGNFSRSDFSHITPTNKTINMKSKKSFRALGVYALPGKTFSLTRTDTAEVNTQVFINTLHSGATHEFDENDYSRPKHIKSAKVAVAPGQTVQLTSAYGGPIQIEFDINDLDVSFDVSNIGLHPLWQGAEDDDKFSAAINANEFDWVELVTPAFEVHSKLEKMNESIADEKWASVSELAAATQKYLHNFPHLLAGFQGPGIDAIDEIIDYAAAKGWTMETIDRVKHMNADQARCGYGCSGNPYDAYWAFDPISHGDLHELGHGLEKARFRFDGWDYHASTNPYVYYSKTKYLADVGSGVECSAFDFEAKFDLLQTSRSEADPMAWVQQQNLTSWQDGMIIYLQMMMAAQAEGVVSDGWYLLTRLHILEREFNRNDDDDTDWELAKALIGFDQFTRTDAKALNNNDWLAIALSKVMERNMIHYLEMWGLAIGDAAKAQIQALALSDLPLNFYASGETDYCLDLNKPAVPIDGVTAWPIVN